jgi:pSer/pThr/pTyr-binding forkhead associated (FHA) protein
MAPRTLKPGTTPSVRLEVRGHGGLLAGVEHALDRGETLVIGRSRSCDLSLRKTSAFRKREDVVTLLGSREFNRVSRIHCEIEYRKDGQVEIRDLSRNGTLVDGVRVGRSHLLRVGGKRVTVELVDGIWGKLLLVERTSPVASP